MLTRGVRRNGYEEGWIRFTAVIASIVCMGERYLPYLLLSPHVYYLRDLLHH